MKKFSSARWWNNVTALRKDAEITEKELSETLGLASTYITNATSNMGVPNVATALAIAEFFETTVESIAFEPIGLELRKKKLKAEIIKMNQELQDIEKDLERG